MTLLTTDPSGHDLTGISGWAVDLMEKLGAHGMT